MELKTANQLVEEITEKLNLVTDITTEVLPTKNVVVYVKIYVTYLIKSNLEFMLQLAEKYHVTIGLYSDRGYFTLLYS